MSDDGWKNAIDAVQQQVTELQKDLAAAMEREGGLDEVNRIQGEINRLNKDITDASQRKNDSPLEKYRRPVVTVKIPGETKQGVARPTPKRGIRP
jgi:septal ring factor EnvC (AmiA/AmiB activator)